MKIFGFLLKNKFFVPVTTIESCLIFEPSPESVFPVSVLSKNNILFERDVELIIEETLLEPAAILNTIG